MEKKEGINWEKWGVIIAIITLLASVFGVSFSCNSCFGGTLDEPETVIEETDDVDGESNVDSSNVDDDTYIPTDEELTGIIQDKNGFAWIEDVPVLSYDCPMTIWGDSIFSYDLKNLAVANTGEEYKHALVMNTNLYYGKDSDKGNHHEIVFYTDGKYETFSFIFALAQETKDNSGEVTVTISADDIEVWSGKTFKNMLPEEVSIDINKALKVSILCTVTEDGNNKLLYSIFGDAHFSYE